MTNHPSASSSRRDFNRLVALATGGAVGHWSASSEERPVPQGSLWFPFNSFDPPGDYYPTNGYGGHGTGALFAESDLRKTSLCYLDGMLCTFNSSGGTFTIKDANGFEIRSFEVTVPMPQPLEIRFGIPIAVYGGFTCSATSVYGIAGIAFYTKVVEDP